MLPFLSLPIAPATAALVRAKGTAARALRRALRGCRAATARGAASGGACTTLLHTWNGRKTCWLPDRNRHRRVEKAAVPSQLACRHAAATTCHCLPLLAFCLSSILAVY